MCANQNVRKCAKGGEGGGGGGGGGGTQTDIIMASTFYFNNLPNSVIVTVVGLWYHLESS